MKTLILIFTFLLIHLSFYFNSKVWHYCALSKDPERWMERYMLDCDLGTALQVSVDNHGCNPLHWASMRGQLSMWKLCAEKCPKMIAELLVAKDRAGWNCAHHAASNGKIKLLRWIAERALLESSPCMGARDRYLAQFYGYVEEGIALGTKWWATLHAIILLFP